MAIDCAYFENMHTLLTCSTGKVACKVFCYTIKIFNSYKCICLVILEKLM